MHFSEKTTKSNVKQERTSKMTEHQVYCYQMFNNARKNYNTDNPFYVFFESITENLDGSATVILEILTPEMLSYDSILFESLILNPEYKPYFSWFRFDIDDPAKITAYQERVGTWTFASFTAKNEDETISGYYEFSASPIHSIKALIRINPGNLPEDIIRNIINTYPCPQSSNLQDISKKLDNTLDGVKIKKARVYKVGNGNLIQLRGEVNSQKNKKNFTMLYDIGYHREGFPNNRNQYNPAITSSKHMHPDCIVISHWDFDHYKGVIYASDDIFKCPWFAPELDKKDGPNLRRLVSYINKRSTIWLIEKGSSEATIYNSTNSISKIFLYRGSGKGDKNIRNSKGLVLVIENKTKNNLVRSAFHGDVPYEAVATTVWGNGNTYNFLVVPHHGTTMHSYNEINAVVNGSAIICCINDTRLSSNRPNTTHTNELIQKGYTISTTEEAKTYYLLDLFSAQIVKK